MTPYEQGFIDKCAEYGVDPQALIKYAQGTNPEYSRPAEAPRVAGFYNGKYYDKNGVRIRGMEDVGDYRQGDAGYKPGAIGYVPPEPGPGAGSRIKSWFNDTTVGKGLSDAKDLFTAAAGTFAPDSSATAARRAENHSIVDTTSAASEFGTKGIGAYFKFNKDKANNPEFGKQFLQTSPISLTQNTAVPGAPK